MKKLQKHKHKGVPEVWFWKKGQFILQAMQDREYIQTLESEALKGINLAFRTYAQKPGFSTGIGDEPSRLHPETRFLPNFASVLAFLSECMMMDLKLEAVKTFRARLHEFSS